MRRLKKKFIVHSEMVKAGRYIKDHRFIDEINLCVDPGKGRNFDFMIELVELSGDKAAMKLRVFSDSFQAFKLCPEVFRILGRFQSESTKDDRTRWPELAGALEDSGWMREKPKPGEKAASKSICPACGKA